VKEIHWIIGGFRAALHPCRRDVAKAPG